MSAFVTY